jgi:predicted transcriptional regulator
MKMFSQKYGLTLKQIADGAGVKVSVLYQVQIGRTPGNDIVPKVDAFIAEYEMNHIPLVVMSRF